MGGQPHRITDDDAADYQPNWSPDGRSLVFASDRGGSPGLWIVPVADGRATGPAVPILPPGVIGLAPAWSPDGHRIAFLGGHPETQGVWVASADGTTPPRQVMTTAGAKLIRWDREPGRLLLSAEDERERIALFSLSIEGGEAKLVEPRVDLGPLAAMGVFDVSSDARWLVYSYDEEEEGDIWVLETQTGTY